MVLLLGKNGYVSKRFQDFFNFKKIEYRAASISTRPSPFDVEILIKALKPRYVINCMGYTGKPNVDACEDHKEECLYSNVVLAEIVADICKKYDVPLGFVSSGCIYLDPWHDDFADAGWGHHFTEEDRPNFDFVNKNCSWYSGTKALGESLVRKSTDAHYIWRLRMPFNHIVDDKNYVAKILKYPKVWSTPNSLSNIDEFVQTCYYSMVKEVPHGTYNIVNPGGITAKEIISMAIDKGIADKHPQYFESLQEFESVIRTPRSDCVLDASKIMNEGFGLLDSNESLDRCFDSWNKKDATIFW